MSSLKNVTLWKTVFISLLLVLFIGLIDFISGKEISFSIFYLLPIIYASWNGNRKIGLFFAALAGLEWLLADLLGGHIYSSIIIGYWNMTVRLAFFVLIVIMISKLKELLQIEQKLSRTDSMTGVSNPRNFNEIAKLEILRAERFNHPLSFAFVDLDNFKWINDNLGHDTGDLLLKSTAQIIQKNIRAIDMIARLGGDEFIIMFPEITKDEARKTIDRIQKILLEYMKENQWPVTFSIGHVTYNLPPVSVNAAIKEADNLMYIAKKNGKNKIEYRTL
ncbi:MAG: GGDEF domain-containing protein [Calditrichaceae bacterium]